MHPSGNIDSDFITFTKGSYLLRWGLIKSLESKMKYHDYMAFKDEYNDEPDKFFDEKE